MGINYRVTQKPAMWCEQDYELNVGRETELGLMARNYREVTFKNGLKMSIMNGVGYQCTDYTYWDKHPDHKSRETRLSFLKGNPTPCMESPLPGVMVFNAI